MSELIFQLILSINIYILLIMSANITTGMTNLLTLCQAAFYGIGAYVSTFFLLRFNLPFLAIAVIVMGASCFFSLAVSLAAVKIKEDYFALATMGLQMIVFTVLFNWTDVTHGCYGIAGIPNIKLLGIWEVSGVASYAFLSLFVVLIVWAIFHKTLASPFGRLLTAIREDESVVASFGRKASVTKMQSFAISSAIAGLAGFIYAAAYSYISPSVFSMDKSISIICALFIGGCGNTLGSVVGAVFMVVLPEVIESKWFLGWLQISSTSGASLCRIIYGTLLIIVIFTRPNGLTGKRLIHK